MDDQEFYRRMRKLIGRRCRHLQQNCTLLEVLADEGLLILRCEEGIRPIQADQFGQALRRASETVQIAVLEEDRETLTPEALELLVSLQPAAG